MTTSTKQRASVFLQIAVCVIFMALTVMPAGCSNEQNKEGDTMKPNEKNNDAAKPAHELTLTDANFDAEAGKGVVLVDFWAPWCGPCLMQGPIVAKVAAIMAGQVKVGKCNVDEAPKISERFGIRSIPTLVILKDNQEVERFVGVRREAELVDALKKHLK
jgi:thioredoxin 1